MKNQKAKAAGFRAQDSGRNESRAVRGNTFFSLIVACCLLPVSAANADELLRDPTRPPAALQAAEEGTEIETGPVLQSVRISQGRYTAVISGETVRVGSRVGDARVIGIRETEVVLKTGNSLQTLKLFPDVEKRPAAHNKRNRR